MTAAGPGIDAVVSTVLLTVVADGVVDAVISDDRVACVDDADAGTEPSGVLPVGPGDELSAAKLDDEPDALGCPVTEPPVTAASDGDWTGAATNVGVDGVATAVEVNPMRIPTAAHIVMIASTTAVTRLDDTAPRARRACRTAITSSAPDVTAARSGFSIRLPRHGFDDLGAARHPCRLASFRNACGTGGSGACEFRRSIGVNGAEDVVVGEEVVKAQVLDHAADPSARGRISSKLNLRVDDADLHGVQPAAALTVLLPMSSASRDRRRRPGF